MAIDDKNISQLPRILVQKSLTVLTTADGINPTYSDAGDRAVFNITITNTGNTRLNQVLLTDESCGHNIVCDRNFSDAASGFLPSSHPDGHPIVCEGTTYLTSDDVDRGSISGMAEVSLGTYSIFSFFGRGRELISPLLA